MAAVHLCWVFPQVPEKAAQLPSESLGRPMVGAGPQLRPLPLQQALISFCGGCVRPDLPSPAPLRWKVLFSLSVASKALPPSGWDETDNGSHFVVV